ncbi:hypothetical protein INT47_009423 [Mucor saturninus]|uniref:Uncharacterized protein n=1 Tax=Mucor saturninus TaxID=64648 RepID=A0A8H7QWY8_9FUNG|nr:hypothetical protein INT47_009423 [Mucor saturninus]
MENSGLEDLKVKNSRSSTFVSKHKEFLPGCSISRPANYSVVPAIYSVVPAIYSVVPAIYSVVPAIYSVVPAIYSVVPAIVSVNGSGLTGSIDMQTHTKLPPKSQRFNKLIWDEIFSSYIRREEGIDTLTKAATPAADHIRQLITPA